MGLAPVWRVAPAANAGSGAAVMGRRHVLTSRGAVMDWGKRRFTPRTFSLLPERRKRTIITCTFMNKSRLHEVDGIMQNLLFNRTPNTHPSWLWKSEMNYQQVRSSHTLC